MTESDALLALCLILSVGVFSVGWIVGYVHGYKSGRKDEAAARHLDDVWGVVEREPWESDPEAWKDA